MAGSQRTAAFSFSFPTMALMLVFLVKELKKRKKTREENLFDVASDGRRFYSPPPHRREKITRQAHPWSLSTISRATAKKIQVLGPLSIAFCLFFEEPPSL